MAVIRMQVLITSSTCQVMWRWLAYMATAPAPSRVRQPRHRRFARRHQLTDALTTLRRLTLSQHNGHTWLVVAW